MTVKVIICTVSNTELIETLWNVNSFRYTAFCPSIYRINRNIVECKWDLLEMNLEEEAN